MFRLIASYPKSGNTYVRIFLAHYLRGETSLNKIGWPIFGSVAHFPLGIPSYRGRIEFPAGGLVRYAKTHEIAQLYYPRFVERAVYIVRNPVDIVPSWSRHMSISTDKAIHAISRNSALKGTDKIFRQEIGSWTTNVRSWLNQKSFPVLFVRYETLSFNPDQAFTTILKFFGVPIEAQKFQSSLTFVKFENLKKKEEEMLATPEKFKEARGSTGKFFNVGRSGNGKEVLTPEQIAAIKKFHGPTMDLLGYA